MAIVLDTSALIELERSLARGEPPDLPTDEGIVIPVIVWAEALIGARLASTPVRAAQRRAQLDAIRQEADIQPFTAEVAEHYADIYAELSHRGALIPQNDIAVAATCRSLGASLLVGPSDEAHFRRVSGLTVRVFACAG